MSLMIRPSHTIRLNLQQVKEMEYWVIDDDGLMTSNVGPAIIVASTLCDCLSALQTHYLPANLDYIKSTLNTIT